MALSTSSSISSHPEFLFEKIADYLDAKSIVAWMDSSPEIRTRITELSEYFWRRVATRSAVPEASALLERDVFVGMERGRRTVADRIAVLGINIETDRLTRWKFDEYFPFPHSKERCLGLVKPNSKRFMAWDGYYALLLNTEDSTYNFWRTREPVPRFIKNGYLPRLRVPWLDYALWRHFLICSYAVCGSTLKLCIFDLFEDTLEPVFVKGPRKQQQIQQYSIKLEIVETTHGQAKAIIIVYQKPYQVYIVSVPDGCLERVVCFPEDQFTYFTSCTSHGPYRYPWNAFYNKYVSSPVLTVNAIGENSTVVNLIPSYRDGMISSLDIRLNGDLLAAVEKRGMLLIIVFRQFKTACPQDEVLCFDRIGKWESLCVLAGKQILSLEAAPSLLNATTELLKDQILSKDEQESEQETEEDEEEDEQQEEEEEESDEEESYEEDTSEEESEEEDVDVDCFSSLRFCPEASTIVALTCHRDSRFVYTLKFVPNMLRLKLINRVLQTCKAGAAVSMRPAGGHLVIEDFSNHETSICFVNLQDGTCSDVKILPPETSDVMVTDTEVLVMSKTSFDLRKYI